MRRYLTEAFLRARGKAKIHHQQSDRNNREEALSFTMCEKNQCHTYLASLIACRYRLVQNLFLFIFNSNFIA